jgi:hypothetical protein
MRRVALLLIALSLVESAGLGVLVFQVLIPAIQKAAHCS